MTAALARAVARADGRPVLLGYSGGVDSGALLHLLAADPRIRASGLRALHVHHGLHPDADAWAAHCRAACEGLRVPLELVRVRVDRDGGLGPEGAAREARHAAFAAALGEGEVLALAHHRDDQAETLLLRALRGAGVDGLAAMRRERAFARGLLWRPLLDAPRAALLAYARAHGLRWIEDPGNAGTDPDRNFLRHAALPLLRQRWPHAADALARSAALCAEAAELLAAGDAAALEAVRRDADTLDVPGLLALPAPRRARVLRRWVAELGLPPLPGAAPARIGAELLAAPGDAGARYDWAGARLQRWRDLLHGGLLPPTLPPGWSCAWDGGAPLALPTGDTLRLHGAPGFDLTLRVHGRGGGERIVLPGRRHSHALKHALQDAGVPPWQRRRLPLLSDGGELLAAGDAIVSARLHAWLLARGARLEWRAALRGLPRRAW